MPTLLDMIQARPSCRRRRMRRRGQHGLHFTCCAPLRWTGCAWYCRECAASTHPHSGPPQWQVGR